jgi:hypothetical protein
MDHNNIDDGRHLIFGVTMYPVGKKKMTNHHPSILNSDNYHIEIDTFPMSRILSKCNMVFIPPEQPNWSEISVETLRGLIQKYRETETVRVFLCETHTESHYYEGTYSEINREAIPSYSIYDRFGSMILSKDNNLALSVDDHGLNPLQYAASIGKKWSDELKTVASIVPAWSHPGNGTFDPFLIAAHSSDDMDTVFELLRFDISILIPQPGSKEEQSR